MMARRVHYMKGKKYRAKCWKLTDDHPRLSFRERLRHAPSSKKAEDMDVLVRRKCSEGHFRFAYYAKANYGHKSHNVIVKRLKHPKGDVHHFRYYVKEMETQFVARLFAKEFGRKHRGLKTVRFSRIWLVRAHRTWLLLEPELRGNYTKFNNLHGVPLDSHATLQAFSHWTYQASHGKMMITDLQGVQNGNVFHLTDPVVHCTDTKRFGHPNRGKRGMRRFFANHRCSDICRALHLYSAPGFGI